MIYDNFEKHILIHQDNQSALAILSEKTSLSKQKIKATMNKGAVWVSRGKSTKRVRRVTKTLKNGDILHIYYDEKVLSTIPVPCRLIADEKYYSVWYKPSGMLSQGSKYGDHCTAYRWVEKNLQPERPVFIVHRLDRAASGIILLAHEKKIAAKFSELFQYRKIIKKYLAIVSGQLTASHYPIIINIPVDGKNAVSHIHASEYNNKKDMSLVDIEILTGRKHQIRRHLLSLKHPIIGDRRYNSTIPHTDDLQLTAYELSFNCPVTNQYRNYQLANELKPSFSLLK